MTTDDPNIEKSDAFINDDWKVTNTALLTAALSYC